MIASIYNRPQTVGKFEPQIDIPINEWWSLKSSLGTDSSWQTSYNRWIDRLIGGTDELGQKLTAEQANNLFPILGQKFDSPIYEKDARTRQELAKIKQKKEELLNATRKQTGLWRGAVGFGAELAGTVWNENGPLNIDFGISTLPIFGTSTKAAAAAKTAGLFGSKTLASIGAKGGLISIPLEKVAFLAKYPNFTETVLNGAASESIGQLVNFLDAKSRDDETHYFAGVIQGTVGAAAWHGGLKTLGWALKKSGKVLGVVTEESKNQAAKTATNQAASGSEPVNATEHFVADENVIRWQSRAQHVDAEVRLAEDRRAVTRLEIDDPAATATDLLIIAKTAIEALREEQKIGPMGDIFNGPIERMPGEKRKAFRARKFAAEKEVPKTEPLFAIAGPMDKALAAKKIIDAVDRIKNGDRSFEAFRDLALVLDRVYFPTVTEVANKAQRRVLSENADDIIFTSRSQAAELRKGKLAEVEAQLSDAVSEETIARRVVGESNAGLSKSEIQAKRDAYRAASEKVKAIREARNALFDEIDRQESVAQRAEQEVGLTKAELEQHVARLDEYANKYANDIREKQVLKLVDKLSPENIEAKEIRQATESNELLKSVTQDPKAEKLQAAKGDQTKEFGIFEEDIKSIRQSINEQIDALTPNVPEGTKLTTTQKKAKALADGLRDLLQNGERQIAEHKALIERENNGLISALNCMKINGTK